MFSVGARSEFLLHTVSQSDLVLFELYFEDLEGWWQCGQRLRDRKLLTAKKSRWLTLSVGAVGSASWSALTKGLAMSPLTF